MDRFEVFRLMHALQDVIVQLLVVSRALFLVARLVLLGTIVPLIQASQLFVLLVHFVL